MAKKTSTRSNAAKKAWVTMRNRQAFIQKYGETTYRVLAGLRQGNGTAFVDVTPGSVAAYKANLTRGAYSDYVTVDNHGNWRDKLSLHRVK